MINPKITRDIDRKTRQILIDMLDLDIIGASYAEIKEKVSTAISKITDPCSGNASALQLRKN